MTPAEKRVLAIVLIVLALVVILPIMACDDDDYKQVDATPICLDCD